MLMLGLSSVCLTQINADEINLPAQESKTMSYSLEQANLSNEALSDWTFLKDKITGDLRLGFGTPIRFSEYTTADESNVEAIAAKFFDQNGKDLGVEKEQLRLVAKTLRITDGFLSTNSFTMEWK